MSPVQISEIWENSYPKVFGYFYKRVNNREDVEDLTSQTMTIFLDALQDENKKIEFPDGYLWRIAHNTLLNFIRKKSKDATLIPLEDDQFEFEQSLEDARSGSYENKVKCLLECIEGVLPEKDLEIVKASILEEKTSKEVASVIGIKSDNVRQRLKRALQKVRENCLAIWNKFKPTL